MHCRKSDRTDWDIFHFQYYDDNLCAADLWLRATWLPRRARPTS